jgi:DNA-binding transcriptional regulator YiaG
MIMIIRTIVCSALLALASAAGAHDLSHDIAKFRQIAAGKKPDSKEAIQARIALERAQAQMDQSENKMVLHMRHITNAALRDLGELPASLPNELKRLEAAVASPKTGDPAKIAKARETLDMLKQEMAAFAAINAEALENMEQALKMIETAPAR